MPKVMIEIDLKDLVKVREAVDCTVVRFDVPFAREISGIAPAIRDNFTTLLDRAIEAESGVPAITARAKIIKFFNLLLKGDE
jgi:hypothetical protein